MTISRNIWDNYIGKLRAINDKASAEMRAWLLVHGIDDTDAMIAFAFALVTKYGTASASLAALMYDYAVELSGLLYPAAVPAAPPPIDEVAKAVIGSSKSENAEIVSAAIGRLVKLQGVDTTMRNALRDGAEWAWIPSGDTCAFCIALSSRGWQKASRKAIKNGHAEHIHANCDCTYAVRFDPTSEVAGYDNGADARAIYDNVSLDGEPDTPENRINAIRRRLYSENRERIRAQQASAYQKRKELNISAAEEGTV